MSTLAERVAAEMWLLEAALGSVYGPRGGHAVLFAPASAGASARASSISSRVLPAVAAALPPDAWASGLLLSLLQPPPPQPSHAPHLGLFAHLLAASIVRRGSALVAEDRISRAALVHGLDGVRAGLVARLSAPCPPTGALLHRGERRIALGSSRDLLAVIGAVLAPKRVAGLSERTRAHIARVVLAACIQSSQPAADILIHSVTGMDPSESACFSGMLLDLNASTSSIPDALLLSAEAGERPHTIALFSVSLAGGLSKEGILGDSDVGLESAGAAAATALEVDSREALLTLGRQLSRDNVSLVVCQRVIHPSLKRFLAARGIGYVERIGVRNVAPLSQLLATVPISTTICPTSGPLCVYGQVSRLAIVSRDARHRFLHLTCAAQDGESDISQPSRAMMTCLVGGDDANSAEELRVACHLAVAAFTALLAEPVVVAGGGCTEMRLAETCRQLVRSRKVDGFAGTLVADALCDTTRRLLDPDGDSQELQLEDLRAADNEAEGARTCENPPSSRECAFCSFGLDAGLDSGICKVMLCESCRLHNQADSEDSTEEILDVRSIKRDALGAAIRASCAVLRVAARITSVGKEVQAPSTFL